MTVPNVRIVGPDEANIHTGERQPNRVVVARCTDAGDRDI
jgi:hypothetical protein